MTRSNFTQMTLDYQHHMTVTNCDDIAEMMLPSLQIHGIKVFNYYRVYFDGTMLRFSTDKAWTTHYFKKNYLHNVTPPQDYLTKKTSFFIWLIEDCHEMLYDAAMNFDTANGITLAKIHTDSVEYFCYASTLNNTRIVNHFYLNNLEKLENFGLYFKDKAKELLKKHENSKIILPKSVNPEQNISYLYQQLHSTIKLSPMQQHCSQLLLQGLRYKDISSALNISARTVETHINAIKTKLGCKHKGDLILRLVELLKNA